MNSLQRVNTKGEATIIGYVLLIVLALGLASVVYGFLRTQVPQDKETCPGDVSIAIESAICANGQINITLENRGLFTIDGAYVKAGQVGRVYKESIDCPTGQTNLAGCKTLFNDGVATLTHLVPGDSINRLYTYSFTGTGSHELEVQPIILDEMNTTKLACVNAVVSKVITCA